MSFFLLFASCLIAFSAIVPLSKETDRGIKQAFGLLGASLLFLVIGIATINHDTPNVTGHSLPINPLPSMLVLLGYVMNLTWYRWRSRHER